MFDEIIGPLIATKWGRRAAWGALIGIALLLLIAVVMMLYSWRQDYLISHATFHPSASVSNEAELSQLITQLPDRHLFGAALDQSLPITSLQLHLVGVIKSEPDSLSRVIISEGGKPGKVYRVGDTLLGEVRINAISNDGVVLENGGKFEKLPLQRTPLQFEGMPKPLLPSDEKPEE